MRLLFTKENMHTGSGFAFDSFLADRALFTAVAATEFDDDFVADFLARRTAISTAVGGALRTGGTAQVTARLYQNMDKVKPLLDLIDIRLGFIPNEGLTVAASKFGLKTLRERLDHRDAEAASRALVVLQQAIADNLSVLKNKGYADQELLDLGTLHKAIDTDNALQNTGLNTNTGATVIEDKDYQALDKLLAKIMRTGRLLFKTTKQKRRQYEAAAILKRMQAGEKPQVDQGIPA